MKLIIVISAVAALLLQSCNSNDNSGSAEPEETIQTGTFSRPVIDGIHYQTASQQGVITDDKQYKYLEGESVTFSIGNITLPEVAAQPGFTLLDLYSTYSVSEPRVINLTRLLLALDTDQIPDNGLSVSESARVAATSDTFINFRFNKGPGFERRATALLEVAGGASSLPAEDPAVSYLLNALSRSAVTGTGNESEGQPVDFEIFHKQASETDQVNVSLDREFRVFTNKATYEQALSDHEITPVTPPDFANGIVFQVIKDYGLVGNTMAVDSVTDYGNGVVMELTYQLSSEPANCSSSGRSKATSTLFTRITTQKPVIVRETTNTPVNTQLSLELLDTESMRTDNEPLLFNPYVGFAFTLEGETFEIASEQPVNGRGASYQQLVDAFNTELAAAGFTTLSASLGATFSTFSSTDGNLYQGTEILITNSGPGRLGAVGWLVDGVLPPGFNAHTVVCEIPIEPSHS